MDKPVVDIDTFDNQDPIEAIYALNIGDFVTESFISEDLLDKIADRVTGDPGKLKLQLQELIQIYSMDNTLSIFGFDQNEGFVIYDSIAATLRNMFQVDACNIFQVAQKTPGESYLSLTGTSLNLNHQDRWGVGIQLGENNLLSDLYETGEVQAIQHVGNQPHWHGIDRLSHSRVTSLLAAPMAEGNKQAGLILFESYEDVSFSPELQDLAQCVATVFVTASRLQRLVAQAQAEIDKDASSLDELRSLRAQITESIADLGSHQNGFVEALGTAIDARHQFTRGHSKAVAQLAKTIATGMDLNEKTVDLVYCAGLLGSLGKIDIPGEVLSKRDDLNTQEWDELRKHPNIGVGLLVQINFLSEVIPYVHYQKERWDGSGGPEGLKAKNIPLGARILAVADALVAMTHERPYRGDPLSPKEALIQVKQEAGRYWDPDVIDALERMSLDALS
ncbi:MAG: HD domain-containing protein [Vampirovibrio sp.]|nr:HD domain-containing protein [Vampirovibrio sp.]